MDVIEINEVLLFSQQDGGYMVVLKESADARTFFRMFVGEAEFLAIAKEKDLVVIPRPLTHELYLALLARTHLTLIRIEIHDLQNRTFLARVIYQSEDGGDLQTLDCRPSDAVALALHAGIPIWVNADLITDPTDDEEGKAPALSDFIKTAKF